MAEVLVPYAPAAGAFGRTAEVTPKDGAPVTGVVIVAGREAPPAVGHLGAGPAASVNLRWIISVPRALVSALPVGSTLLADIDGEGTKSWRVDRVDRLLDEFRAVVS
jgi:hypothetical protein